MHINVRVVKILLDITIVCIRAPLIYMCPLVSASLILPKRTQSYHFESANGHCSTNLKDSFNPLQFINITLVTTEHKYKHSKHLHMAVLRSFLKQYRRQNCKKQKLIVPTPTKNTEIHFIHPKILKRRDV